MEKAATTEQAESWQERLATDRQGGALRELRDYLAEKQGELRRFLDAGTDQETYELHQKFLTAVEAADKAALTFWERHNKE